ncbi:hypothetical protein Tco_1552160 [Tanacetum coccineum]
MALSPESPTTSTRKFDEWVCTTTSTRKLEDEDEVERNEVDSDLESTASSKPVWEKTTKADRDRASHHCPWCSK